MIKSFKDKLYYYAVTKNVDIKSEYERYVVENLKDHNSKRFQHWLVLARLNWHYRIKRAHAPLIYARPRPVPKRKMPYVMGAESECYTRPNECSFVNSLSSYDVISFDIFDTLIMRPFSKPQELFMMLGYKFGVMDFKEIRQQAERKARELRKEEFGDTEINIYDIYKIVQGRTGIDYKYGAQTEFETELEFCCANPYMLRVFNMLKAQGKQLIAVSDMYLPKEMIVRLLEKCGYFGFFEIYVSCEYHQNKREGSLYKTVLNDIAADVHYAHVGDNIVSDIESAKENGITPYFYKNVHEIGNPLRCDGMSELVGAVYRGLVNIHLHNGVKKYSVPYEFGFIYGGLYVLGYCNWIHQYAKDHNVDKILFLSRDGSIYQRIFNKLYSDIDNEYVYWSRIANIKYVSEAFKDDFIKRMIIHRSGSVVKMSIEQLFESLNLTSLTSKLKKYGLSEDDYIERENVENLITFFVDVWDEVILLLNKNIDIVEKYFEQIIKGCSRIAVVDVGWQGTGPLGIKYLIQDKMKRDCKVDCLLAVNRIFTNDGNLHTLMGKDVVPYIFSRMFNRNLYDTHSNTNNNTNNIYFELFTQDTTPSFSGWDENGNFMFEVPEVENYSVMQEIHKGIEDFCMKYTKTFSNYPFMLNISGYDAYLPFRFIIKDLSYFRKFFGDFSYSRGVLSNQSMQTLESLNEIMDKAGV